MLVVLSCLGICYLFVAFLFRTGSEINQISREKEFAIKHKRIAYYDRPHNIYRMTNNNQDCIEHWENDSDSNSYNYYLSKNGKFLGAQYLDFGKDEPIKYKEETIRYFIQKGYISNRNELYSRWNQHKKEV